MYNVYGERYHKYDPIIDNKTKEVLDNGEPKRVKLSSWIDEKSAKIFAENVKNNVPKRSWKVFVEEEKP